MPGPRDYGEAYWQEVIARQALARVVLKGNETAELRELAAEVLARPQVVEVETAGRPRAKLEYESVDALYQDLAADFPGNADPETLRMVLTPILVQSGILSRFVAMLDALGSSHPPAAVALYKKASSDFINALRISDYQAEVAAHLTPILNQLNWMELGVYQASKRLIALRIMKRFISQIYVFRKGIGPDSQTVIHIEILNKKGPDGRFSLREYDLVLKKTPESLAQELQEISASLGQL